jgi:signal transduction histidine kinase
MNLACVLLVCGILMTGVLMICSSVSSYTDRIKIGLCRNTELLTGTLSEAFADKADAEQEVARVLEAAGEEYGYLCWVYDVDGNLVYPYENQDGSTLSAATRAMLRTETYMELGYFTKDAVNQQLCCTMQFQTVPKNDEAEPETYYIAVLSDAEDLQEYTLMLSRNLIVCLLVALLLFLLLFRIGANRLDRQFEEISVVVAKYAEGDFSERISLQEHASLYAFGCTLNRMAEFIEQNESTRKNFVANVSHELRTPMTTIGGFADGILDGTIPPEQHQKYIRIIADEIHRLRTLVNSMLNLSKFEAGEMSLRIVNLDIAQLLIKTVLMFEKRIDGKGVNVEGLEDVSLPVRADEDFMFQVLYNLIENAVKFVNDGGTISFSLRTEGRMACICIKNTGEGLADDELPKVFDRFYKTDTSRSKDTTGLGLGLSIARKIVQLHQGSIVVKSVKGEYTAFEVQIPVAGPLAGAV